MMAGCLGGLNLTGRGGGRCDAGTLGAGGAAWRAGGTAERAARGSYRGRAAAIETHDRPKARDQPFPSGALGLQIRNKK